MTLFERIAAGEIPSYKIQENDSFLAILDIFPSHPGQVLVFPKQAVTSKFSEVPADILSAGIDFAQSVAKLMEARLENVARVILVIEGLEVEHFHIKLYPVYADGEFNHGVTKGGEKSSDDGLKAFQQRLIA